MNTDRVNELFDELDLVVHEKWTAEDKWEQIRLLALAGRTLMGNDRVADAIRHRIMTSYAYDKEGK